MVQNQPEGQSAPDQFLQSQAENEPIIVSSNCPTVYANNMGIGMTVFDVAVTFGEVVGVREGRTVIQPRVKILISPLMAKILGRSLTDAIGRYEQQFGEVKEPGSNAIVEK